MNLFTLHRKTLCAIAMAVVSMNLAYAQTLPSDADCVLNWAETQAPKLLQPHAKKTWVLSKDILYREYPTTGIYIGINNATSSVLAVGGILGDTVIRIGAVDDFLSTARFANCGTKQGFISVSANVAFKNTFWGVQNYVITNEVEFRQFWESGKPRTYNSEGIAVTYTLPQIDFSKYTLIGVVLNDMPNGCYGFSIIRTQELNGAFEVESKIFKPPPSAICTGALVPAFDFVLVEKTNLPIKFIESQ